MAGGLPIFNFIWPLPWALVAGPQGVHLFGGFAPIRKETINVPTKLDVGVIVNFQALQMPQRYEAKCNIGKKTGLDEVTFALGVTHEHTYMVRRSTDKQKCGSLRCLKSCWGMACIMGSAAG
jgi:hypothetical protein